MQQRGTAARAWPKTHRLESATSQDLVEARIAPAICFDRLLAFMLALLVAVVLVPWLARAAAGVWHGLLLVLLQVLRARRLLA